LPTHTHTRTGRNRKRGLALAFVLAIAALPVAPAAAGDGGTGTSGSNTPSGSKAKLDHGQAIAPSNAPSRVVKVIEAANKIAKGKPYCYGGGHGSFKSSCYDCSGSVSYALHGGHFVDTPLDSSGFMRWGKAHAGNWITVYANSGHAYAVIAGLRFDTSMTPGEGPGWSKEIRSHAGFKVRHPAHY
jgi:cell wall-associated NlpC family hydrolase